MNENTGIFWVRNDFRITKNKALSFVSNNHSKVSAIYIFKKTDFENKREAQRWWIYKSLTNFNQKLKKYNINLELMIADTYESAFKKILEINNFSIYWNKIYEPSYLRFDKNLKEKWEDKNIFFKIFKGNILNEENEVKKNDGTPFKVFTPFWRTAESIYIDKEFPKKDLVKKTKSKIKFLTDEIDYKKILPKKNWYKKFEDYWIPSEEEGLKIKNDFIKNKIKDYGENRDNPDINGTSKISPYLSFGQLNVEDIWESCNKISEKKKGYRKFIN